MTKKDEKDLDLTKLELLLDKYGIAILLDMLAEICTFKADHVRDNWQDTVLMMRWDHRATLIFNLLKDNKRLLGDID